MLDLSWNLFEITDWIEKICEILWNESTDDSKSNPEQWHYEQDQEMDKVVDELEGGEDDVLI